ncbi:L,D-transpeptidase family protein [Limibacillus halophilus]|uniref:Murein L,D-transpeptidase YcbB/YkuD n=1 Tax=Limibacillus halophilus TaxID=1579333 RepID=A0A839SPY2_9PROT|nr:L,D-transpeptidase family protein [Limibacillus halophilus]MBB3063810.1 murein L,D-transpeptidase YcbB/YkuD [Limibacillus halophilus]
MRLSQIWLATVFLLLFLTPQVWASKAFASAALEAALREALDKVAATTTGEDDIAELALLHRFYTERDWQALWVGEDRALPSAFRLGEVLKNADEEGLDPTDYHSPAIQALLASAKVDLLAPLEIRLTQSLVRYGADLNGGRLVPRQVDPELFVYPRDLDRYALLQAVAGGGDVSEILAGLAPQDDSYRALKSVLARYRLLAAMGGWNKIGDGSTLDPGVRDDRVIALRTRLRTTGELRVADEGIPDDPRLYDATLQRAVERFQANHGLGVDGRVGKNTLAHLNTSVEARVQQILANLERERWVAGKPVGRHLAVNLADFTLRLYDEGREVFTSKVVIGTPYNRTPVFRRDMTYLEINPFWNVPPSIAGKELLPKIRKNPAYLEENGYELFSSWSDSATLVDPHTVDWGAVTAGRFPYKIRQKPGIDNALGRIKFMLPNEFNIYLHDTPAKALFSRAERSFSHGCVRVDKPIDLAVAVLQDEATWNRELVVAAIEKGERRVVSLAKPLPVQIDYQTAWVNDAGVLQFRGDVYGRDALLISALLGPRSTAESLPTD